MIKNLLKKFRTSPTPKIPAANDDKPLMTNDEIIKMQIAFSRKGKRREYQAKVRAKTTQILFDWVQSKRA